jgi:AmmeMemoRadiSam system protein B
MVSVVREPVVAGRFYPGKAELLLREVRQFTSSQGEKARALGCVVPHAGYMYSGHVAGAVYAKLQLPKRFVILCPNHTGMGEPLSIMSAGAWLTPLGEAGIDRELAQALKNEFALLHEDRNAHRSEHALEVQLPFLQVMAPEFTFVPIVVGTAELETLEGLGRAIAKVLSSAADEVLVIASSDMNHYESDRITRVKDSMALAKVLALDAPGLHQVVTHQHVTMCGYGPAIAMLTAAKQGGATTAELVRYATSGDISGERDSVVGYAGIIVR